MNVLTQQIGWLPVGLWLVSIILVVGLLIGIIGQAISIVSWKTALAWRLQEDDPDSSDPAERAFFAVEWGTAAADVLVQSVAMVLAVYGLVAQHWTGLLGATMLFTIYVYYGLAFFLRFYAIKLRRLGDWSRLYGIGLVFLVMAETMGLVGLAGLWSNWRYFTG